MNIGSITEKHARLSPGAVAIIDKDAGKRVTFEGLDKHVRSLANGLLSLGLTNGDRVAILSKNSAEFMALYLACGRSGLIAQPLNWRLSAPELSRILEDGEPLVVISQDQFTAQARELRGTVTCVEHWLEYGSGGDGSYETLIQESPDTEPAPQAPVRPDDPLYILYTGGSTGQSKGVLHSHASTFYAMVNNLAAEAIRPSDVYMLTGPMFHSPIVMALTYLSAGCPVVLLTFEPRTAMEAIHEEGVTAFLSQQTMISRMIALPDFDSFDVSTLRHIKYGGGPFPASVVKYGMEHFGCDFIGVYGQTEGIAMTFLNYEDHTNAVNGRNPERLTSCGREAYMTNVKLVDESGRQVPCDGKTVGEIYVRSPANMLGYWKRPDLTEQTIRDGWMSTGDLATWDQDRYVFIIDRAKDMIISGGENIYSAQVEKAIHQHPAVSEAAVIGVPDPDWGEAVKAFVVLKPGHVATEKDIIDTAKLHLASYQKPRSVEFIDALPTAPTGKVLKRELREPYWKEQDRKV